MPLDNILTIVDELMSTKSNNRSGSNALSAYNKIISNINTAKNNIIKHLLSKHETADKVEIQTPTKNYATALYSTENIIIPVSDTKPNTTEITGIEKRVAAVLASSDVKIIKASATDKGNVVIKLKDTNKNININEKLKDEFGEDVIIRKPFMPKIKIVSVPQYFNTDNNQNIVSSIIEENKYLQNFYDKDKDCMQYIFSYNTNGRKSIIIKCSPEVRRALKEQIDTITIGQFECKLYDRIHVLQCSNCCKYGHTKKVCKNKTPTCTLCSGSHFYKDCQVKTEDKTCNNCLNHKDINIKEQAGTHHAFSNTCPILKSEKSKIIKRTNFGFSFVEDK